MWVSEPLLESPDEAGTAEQDEAEGKDKLEEEEGFLPDQTEGGLRPGLGTGALGLREEHALVGEGEGCHHEPDQDRDPPGRPQGQKVDLEPRVDHPEVAVQGHGGEEGHTRPAAQGPQEEHPLARRTSQAPGLVPQVEGGVKGQAGSQQEVR